MADEPKKCKTPNCRRKAVYNEEYCIRCFRTMSDIQSSKTIPKMLKSLKEIKEILTNNQLVIPTQTASQKTTVNEETEVFIPTIEVPDIEVKGDNTKQIETDQDLTSIAEKLNNIEE